MNPALAELVRLLAAAAVDDFMAEQARPNPHPTPTPPAAPTPRSRGAAVRPSQKAQPHEKQ